MQLREMSDDGCLEFLATTPLAIWQAAVHNIPISLRFTTHMKNAGCLGFPCLA
jgi:hypothetical protein